MSNSPIDYNNRTLRSASNTPNGEVSSATIFHYRQDPPPSNTVWATYLGGSISLNARYQHVNDRNELMTGKCRSVPEILSDGRLRLHEEWEWTSGDCSKGTSVVEEQSERNGTTS
ncbi:hypothetical protein LTS08_008559 [Lithohypha guttulata]|nr:hypothetical protein LTS08_008559 [Lithohypha guttulata]